MEFMDDGWRVLIWLGLAAAGVYLLLSLWRLFRLGRRPPEKTAGPTTAAASPARAPAEPDLLFFAARTPVAKPADGAGVADAADAAAGGTAPAFADQLSTARLQAEVERLRDELGLWRGEVERLGAELATLRAEMEGPRQPRPVSPFYGEAMALAERGYDALGIAEECGISVSEAELLLAMSGRPPKPGRGEENDGIWRGRAVAGR